jgi:hypothetical protein
MFNRQDRPMFDDEHLPAWMTKAGITHATPAQPATPAAAQEGEYVSKYGARFDDPPAKASGTVRAATPAKPIKPGELPAFMTEPGTPAAPKAPKLPEFMATDGGKSGGKVAVKLPIFMMVAEGASVAKKPEPVAIPTPAQLVTPPPTLQDEFDDLDLGLPPVDLDPLPAMPATFAAQPEDLDWLSIGDQPFPTDPVSAQSGDGIDFNFDELPLPSLDLPPVKSAPPPAVAAIDDEDTPSWLKEVPGAPADFGAIPVASAKPAAPLDDLNFDDPMMGLNLGELDFSDPAFGTPNDLPADPTTSDLALGDLPDWMREAAPPAATLPPAKPAPATSLPAEGDTLDWLTNAPSGSFSGLGSGVPPTQFPATGIRPELVNPAPSNPAAGFSSDDLDALLSLPIPEKSAAPPSVDLERLDDMSDLPELEGIGSSFPTNTGFDDLSQFDTFLMDDPLSSGYDAYPPEPEKPRPIGTGYLQLPQNPDELGAALGASSVSFDDTMLDEVLGPPSGAFKLGTGSLENKPQSQPLALDRKSGLIQTGALRKLPARPTDNSPADIESADADELPDFIQEIRPADAPVEIKIGGMKIGVKEEAVSSLPESLQQLRERTKELRGAKEEGLTPEAGALAEIAGVLSPAALPEKVDSGIQTPKQVINAASDLQNKRVKLLQTILEVEDETAPAAKKAGRPRRLKLDRFLIATLLFVAILAPFITDQAAIMTPPDLTTLSAAQKSAFSTLDSLPNSGVVLVAFEYSPAATGELDDLTRAILRDLFKKNIRPVILSTNANSTLYAQSLLAVFSNAPAELTALNRTTPLVSRKDYIVLRYLPAGASGVRAVYNALTQGGFEAQTQFATDLEGRLTNLTPADLASLANNPVIVLAETPDDVRNWAEQYRLGLGKMLFGVSAAAETTARVYAETRPATVIGPLVGLRDSTVYRLTRQPPTDPRQTMLISQRWQSTGLGALMAGVLILLGSLFGLIRALLQTRKRPVKAKG